ncbi:MAG: hypothetical protein IKS87_07465 [Lachnospiraceae bacterium]|nr:hypothetical protein [Lachnospiraceae bacterium]
MMKHYGLSGRMISILICAALLAATLSGCERGGSLLDKLPGGEKTEEKEDTKKKKGLAGKLEEAAEQLTGDEDSYDEDVPDYDDVPVDEEWQKVLLQNGTFYDAFYRLPVIMQEDKGDHPDNVQMPAGLSRDNYDYYNNGPEKTEHKSEDMSEVAGTWIPISSAYDDIVTDFTWAREADVGFHLILNEDGTGSCNIYDGDQPVTWNEKTITLPKPAEQKYTYYLEDNRLIMAYAITPEREMVLTFERDNATNAFLRGHENDETQYLGRRLPEDAKVYRLVRKVENGVETKASADDAQLNPKTHFFVLAETDEDEESGYGYMRDGKDDTAIYYETKRNLIKLIDEDTSDRSGGTGRRKFELEDNGRVLRFLPHQGDDNTYSEYELSQGEEAPRCHLSIGPLPDREFEIPEGTHKEAGFWRLDRIPAYMYFYTNPFLDGSADADFGFIWGTDTRKYDADIWYVLKKDGTGYMRVWDKYFEVVWSDDEQYYIDVSGRHKLGTVVGEVDYDDSFVRLFKDEINEVPEYPEELKEAME